jgi:EpsI family protein
MTEEPLEEQTAEEPKPRPQIDWSGYRPQATLVVALMAAVCALSLWFSRKPDPNVPIADVKAITLNAGDWHSQGDLPIDDVTMQQIKADTYFQRRYTNAKGQNVDLLVVYRRYGRREFAHRPELCFPAAGYNIVSKGRATLPYGGRDVPVVHLFADGSHVVTQAGTGVPNSSISYFFASGNRTECDFLRQQVWMALERLIPNKNGWTFIRLTSDVPGGADDATLLAAQQDFMRAIGPDIERVITTDKASDLPAPAKTAFAGR